MKRCILCLVFTILVLTLTGCAEKEELAVMDSTVTVGTVTATRGALQSECSYIGSVSAEGTARVISLVSANVEKINVQVGDRVTEGQTLCELDDTAAQLTLAQAHAAVSSAEAGISSAEASISSAAAGISSAKAGVTSAEAGVTSAEASVTSAEAGRLSAEASAQQVDAAVYTAQQSYLASLAQYGAETEEGEGEDKEEGKVSLPALEKQVKMAEENYENTKALLDIGAASQIEVDQAYQTMLTAQNGLQAAKAGLNAAQAGVMQAEAGQGSVSAGNASVEAGVGMAQAGVNAARAGVNVARAGVNAAQAGMSAAQAGMSAAQAGMEQAQVAVASAEYQLSLYRLTSPIDGMVEAVYITENNFAATGNPAFLISSGDRKNVTFYVTDQVHKTLQIGQDAVVSVGDETYPGTIIEVANVVDPQAGLFKIKASVMDNGELPDGLSVQLTTAAYAEEDAVLIPSDALYFENGEAYVYLAQGGAAVKTPVTVGLYTADTIAVTGGLNEGDQVIDTWSAALHDGAAIRIAGEG